jgi:outer membrane biosynthesis protein TonB
MPDFSEALALQVVRDDVRTLAAVRLGQAYSYFWAREDEEAAELAAQVRATDGLPADDPTIADAIRLQASLAAGDGDMAAARTAQAALGPQADPCDVPRRLRPVNTSPNDYPNQAMRWGFEGWASVESTVGGDGVPAEIRTVMAYPPFVFGEAAQEVAGRTRYERLYLPEGVRCQAERTTVEFRVAD